MAVEYDGWDFQRCVRGLGAYLLRFFRKRGLLIPLVVPTCKKKGSQHTTCGKDTVRHAVN